MSSGGSSSRAVGGQGRTVQALPPLASRVAPSATPPTPADAAPFFSQAIDPRLLLGVPPWSVPAGAGHRAALPDSQRAGTTPADLLLPPFSASQLPPLTQTPFSQETPDCSGWLLPAAAMPAQRPPVAARAGTSQTPDVTTPSPFSRANRAHQIAKRRAVRQAAARGLPPPQPATTRPTAGPAAPASTCATGQGGAGDGPQPAPRDTVDAGPAVPEESGALVAAQAGEGQTPGGTATHLLGLVLAAQTKAHAALMREIKAMRAENKIILQTCTAVRTSTSTVRQRMDHTIVELTRVSSLVGHGRDATATHAGLNEPASGPAGGNGAGPAVPAAGASVPAASTSVLPAGVPTPAAGSHVPALSATVAPAAAAPGRVSVAPAVLHVPHAIPWAKQFMVSVRRYCMGSNV